MYVVVHVRVCACDTLCSLKLAVTATVMFDARARSNNKCILRLTIIPCTEGVTYS